MRWSSILKKEDSLEVGSDVSVLEFVPPAINFGTPEAALDYLTQKEAGSDFIMSDVIRKTTGIEEIEKQSEEQKIEQKVLEKLAVLQQDAYQQAFELGLEEGQKRAYNQKISELNHQIENFVKLAATLNEVKQEMIHQNEAHILRLIYDIASKLAFDHVEEKPESVVHVIKKSIETAQAEENINVLVSQEQLAILEKMKQEGGKEFDFLKNVKIEGSDKVTLGSCIVETNYGVIDARIDERVKKLWSELKQTIPKVKSPIEPS